MDYHQKWEELRLLFDQRDNDEALDLMTALDREPIVAQSTAAASYSRRLGVANAADRDGKGQPWYAVHVPIKGQLPEHWAWVTDGDAWSDWGTKDPFDRQHAVILTSGPGEFVDMFTQRRGTDNLPDLIDFGSDPTDRVWFVVTDPLDWGKQYWEVRDLRG